MDVTAKMLLWTEIAAVGQVMGAIATFAAVLVSLYLARSDRRPALRVSAGLRMIIPGDGTAATDILAVKVENVGTRAVRIASAGWITGWRLRGPQWLRLQMAVQLFSVGSHKPPVDLAPGMDVLFYLTVNDFRWDDLAAKNIEFFGRKLPWRSAITPGNIKVSISVVGFRDVRTRVEPTLARFFITGRIEAGAESFNARGGVNRDDD